MTRRNQSSTQHTLRHEAQTTQQERELAILDGLRGADGYLRQHAARVGQLDVSATVALRVLDFLAEDVPVHVVRQVLFDVAQQRAVDLSQEVA